MAWKKSDSLISRHLQQHGLTGVVQAGLACREAEKLYPGLFRAVSLRKTCLHIELSYANATQFLLIKGKLLKDLKPALAQKKLPPVERFTLTYTQEDANL